MKYYEHHGYGILLSKDPVSYEESRWDPEESAWVPIRSNIDRWMPEAGVEIEQVTARKAKRDFPEATVEEDKDSPDVSEDDIEPVAFAQAPRDFPEVAVEEKMESRGVSADDLGSMAAYIMSGNSVDSYITNANVAPGDLETVKRLWADIKDTWDNLEPGMQMVIPAG